MKKSSKQNSPINGGIYFGLLSNIQLNEKTAIQQRDLYYPQKIKARLQSPKKTMSPKPVSIYHPQRAAESLFKPHQKIVSQRPQTAKIQEKKSLAKLKSFELTLTNNQSIEELQEVVDIKGNLPRSRTRPNTAMKHRESFLNNPKITAQYLQQEIIGQGSYAVVKKAFELNSGQTYAMKVYERSKNQKKAIMREIQILQLLQHPNIVKLYDVIYTETQIQLILEFAGTLSLRAHLKTFENRQLPEAQAKQIFGQIVKAIDYCHSQNVLHRDIKMENILIQDGRVKIIDFGFSTFIDPKLNAYCGTPSYMAPEIINRQEYGKPADIWALGILLYVMLNGKFPFQGSTNKELSQKIKQGHFIFNSKVSNNAQRLINNILRIRQFERLTTREVLYLSQQIDSQGSMVLVINMNKELNNILTFCHQLVLDNQRPLQLTQPLNYFNRKRQLDDFNSLAFKYFEKYKKPVRSSSILFQKPQSDPYLCNKSYFKIYTERKNPPKKQKSNKKQIQHDAKQRNLTNDFGQFQSLRISNENPIYESQSFHDISFRMDQLSSKKKSVKSSYRRSSQKKTQDTQTRFSVQRQTEPKQERKSLLPRKQRSFSMKAEQFTKFIHETISEISIIKDKYLSRHKSLGQLTNPPKQIQINLQKFKKK